MICFECAFCCPDQWMYQALAVSYETSRYIFSITDICITSRVHSLPGFRTQRFDFIFFNELTPSELLYLSVQVTDVPHCDTHRESCSHTMVTHSSSHTPGSRNNRLFLPRAMKRTVTTDCALQRLYVRLSL